jgi:phosphate transport system substrate-binding protein
MLKKGLILSSAVALAFGALVGCSSKGNQTDNSNAGSKLTGTITAVGSTAMQPVVDEAGKQFQAKNPGVQVNVQGGGSGQGLTAAMNNQADIGNSDLFAEEKAKIDPTKIVDHKVFVVGIAPVANPQVGVDNLTQDQLIKIFTGQIKNWKEVGGKDQKIVLVNRPESSGTRAVFAKFALKGNKEFRGQGGIVQDSSGAVKKIIAETPGAIGYLAFSYLDNTVKALKINGVEPTNDNVATNKWTIWAYEHMYTPVNGKNNKLAEQFIQFIQSPEVQDGLVKKLGYIPITMMKVERDAAGNVKQK